MELRAGARLDRYTLVAPLGEGGQAAVWKVIDPLDGGAVRALKIFQLRGTSAQNAERARREAKAVAGSRHPGLLPCRTLIEDPENDLLALVFDYARGLSLADALSDPRMTAELRRAALRQVADTLAYVHGRGVVHRDVKPDNVLVTDAFWGSPAEAGTLKLVDFGIAAPAGNPKPLTREGGVVGTAPYLPPELADFSGLFEMGNDFQRDVFAFGVLGWEVLVGGHPTGLPLGASRDAFAGIYLSARAGRRVWPPEAPGPAELEIVRSCLSLSARGRPESCIAVAGALRTGVLGAERPRTSEPVSLGQGYARASQTEMHVPPRTVLPSEARYSSAPASPRAAVLPGEARYSSAPASPPGAVFPGAGYAYPPAAPPAPERKKSGRTALIVGAGLMGVLMVGAAALTTFFVVADDSPPAPPAEASPAPVSTTVQSPIACCSDTGTCPSRRACEQPPCAKLGNMQWRLRVADGYLGSGEPKTRIQETWPSSSICLKNTRTGEEQCASSKLIWTTGSDPTHRLSATTDDLVEGYLQVHVFNGTNQIKPRIRAFGAPDGYRTTALCIGVKLHLGAFSPDQGYIVVFLDDP